MLAGALAQAKDARLTILEVMAEAIDAPDEMSPYAPRVTTIKIPVDKIGEVIGPKGKMINSITEQTGAAISIEDDGTVFVGATDGPSAQAAIDMINAIANPQLPEVGERFLGTVVKTTDFGAFVSLLPGRDGLVHISKLGRGKRVAKVEDVVQGRRQAAGRDRRHRQPRQDLAGPGADEDGSRHRDAGGRAGRCRDRQQLTDRGPICAPCGRGAVAEANRSAGRGAPHRPAGRPAGGHRVPARRCVRPRSASGSTSDRATKAPRWPAPRTSWSICCSSRRPTRTAVDIAQAIDAVGGELNAFTANEHTCYYAHVLDSDLEMAVDLVADVVLNGAAPPTTSNSNATSCSKRSPCATTTPRTRWGTCSCRRCSATTRWADR